ncbi:hypothetical protein [Roseivirga sp.]|uniref:hypothetical protein n=1 Tax=Roseivirga sp. TaxID=1964215 RepID=UPI003B517B99
MMKRFLLAILLIGSIQQVLAQNTSAKEVIEAMYNKYKGQWYTNLTFVQKTSFYSNEELQREETWFEAMKIPEALIIKFESLDSGNGMIFKNDSMQVFRNGVMANSMRRVHDILVLGFTVYADSPEKSIARLEEAGYDFSSLTETDQYYIIGDPSSKQAWIEKERLLFTKSKSINPDGSESVTEFNKYEKLGKAWIAPEVVFYRNNQMVMKEEYYEMSIAKKLDMKIFNSSKFKDSTW